jgi:hypothetical protein
MWIVKTNVIPVIIGQLQPSKNNSDNTWATFQESKKSSNYRKQPYWALIIVKASWATTLHVSSILNKQ